MSNIKELANQLDNYISGLDEAGKASLMQIIFNQNHIDGYNKMRISEQRAYSHIHSEIEKIRNRLKREHPIASFFGFIPSHEELFRKAIRNGISFDDTGYTIDGYKTNYE